MLIVVDTVICWYCKQPKLFSQDTFYRDNPSYRREERREGVRKVEQWEADRLRFTCTMYSVQWTLQCWIECVLDQVDRRDYGEGFRHKSPQREGRRETRREKSQSEPERGGSGNKGRNAVFAAQKMVRRVWIGWSLEIFQAREREAPRNPDGWQKESSLKRRKGRFFEPSFMFLTFEVGPRGELKLKREAN